MWKVKLSQGRAPIDGASRRTWSRRILLLGSALCVGALRRRTPADALAALPADTAQPLAAGVFGDPAALARVGALYLAAYPGEADAGHLWHMVGRCDAELAGFKQALRQRIDRDWRALDMVVIEGWVFARTEARLCAALHLGHPAG